MSVQQLSSYPDGVPPRRGVNAKGKQTIIITAVFWAFSTLLVALRFYARRVKRVPYCLEDWLCLAGLIVFYGFNVVVILLMTYAGMGWNVWDIPPDQLQDEIKLTLAAQILFAVSLGFVKLSITTFIHRVFSGSSRWFRIACWCVLALVTAWIIITILVTFLICRPLNQLWSFMPIRGTCGNATAAYVGIAASDVFTDLLVVLLPQPVIWKLYLPIGTKLGISGIICVGLLSIGMGVARLVGMLQTDFNNYTIATKDDYWAVIEIATAIFTCCGPALQPLVRQWAAFRSQNSSKPKVSGSSFARHSNKKGSSKPSQYDDFVGDDLPLSSFGVHNEINCPPHGDALNAAEANIESPSGSLQRTDGAPSLSKGIVVEKSWTTY